MWRMHRLYHKFGYFQLQNEEVLQSLRGRGVAVCEGAKKPCVADRQQILAERLAAVLDEAIRGGLDEDRL